jgi:uncharacterized protein (TIGR02246 family)
MPSPSRFSDCLPGRFRAAGQRVRRSGRKTRMLRAGPSWILILGILLHSAACSEEQQKVSAATAAEAIWKEYSESLNSGDLERWLDLWTEDGIQMPPDEAAVVGLDSIRARNDAFLDKFTVDIGITNQELQTAGDWAYSRGIYKARLVPKEGGRPISIDGKYLTILARQADGSWRIHRDIFNSNTPPALR